MQVVNLDAKTLRSLQMVQLELLREVDRICRKCDIRYNIIAGTLLGAVRHSGYIPWDDDADVAFLRPEYEKFRIACETELDTEKFYFQDHRNTPGYRWGYGKLRRKNTLFLRENQEHMPYEQGVFIDIFPLDGVPDCYVLRWLHNCICTLLRKTLWSAVGRKADRNPVKRFFYALLYRIPAFVVFQCYRILQCWSNRRRTKYVRILTFPTPNAVYGYERIWYETSEKIRFEGYTFWGIKEVESYLRFKFGDYLNLPPEEERKTHPVSALRLLEKK